MNTALEILMRFGLPYGPTRACPRGVLDDRAVAHAVAQIAEGPHVEGAREPLVAWLSAFQHHWPERFVSTMGPEGVNLLAWLRARMDDPSRFLKLRRIAIENLAGLL